VAKVNMIRWDASNLVPQLLGAADTAMINAIDVTGSGGNLVLGGSDATSVSIGSPTGEVILSGSTEAIADFTASQGADVLVQFGMPAGTATSIGGTALPSQFTAANVTTLLNGSNADALHNHALAIASGSLTSSLLIDPDLVHTFTTEVVISGSEVVYLAQGDNVVALADSDDISTSRKVLGFASGSSAVIYTSGSDVPVFTFFGDRRGGFSGLTPAAIYYLDSTPGQLTTAPLASGGRLVLKMGVATSATEILIQPELRVRGLA